MDCLHCGDCCTRMSPLSEGPCPHIVRDGSFVFCGIYALRPGQCRRHEYPCSRCPVGLDVLGIHDSETLRRRIDVGFEKTQKLKENKHVDN
jgi:hypothetical protein